MGHTIHAGIIQFDVALGDRQANLDQALFGIRKLAKQGVQLAVLPELWAHGFDNPNLTTHAETTASTLEVLAAEADTRNIIIAGSLAEHAGSNTSKVYNTFYVIDRTGRVAGRYRKSHLFSITRETDFFAAGTEAVVCHTSVGRLGLMICYDLRFPELCRTLALLQADAVLICAQWPTARIHHWETLIRARAIENQVFIVAANRCGNDREKIHYGGQSLIVSPFGETLAVAENEPVLLSATLDTDETERFRDAIPCLRERRPDIYKL